MNRSRGESLNISLPNRRDAIRLLAGAAGAVSFAAYPPAFASAPKMVQRITPNQDAFLDDLERRGCQFFFDHGDAKTGQVLDRAVAEGKERRRVASVAATGFGLTALCIADKRGYLPAAEIRTRVLRTLEFYANKAPREHGFFYHFSDAVTGARQWKSELSSIDTSLFLCGALTCRAYFTGEGIEGQIRSLATEIFERVDWLWMLDGGPTYSMGWLPESGFLTSRWNHYSELIMIYLLGIGSPTHPVDAKTWQAFARPFLNYDGFHYISGFDPLFTHQFSHAWFDLRNKRDRYADYFANSILATRAHKAFCLDRGAPYSEDYWGITASDSQFGYTAWGGPPMLGKVDGSVVPCATAGSLVFLPQDCLRVLMSLREKYPRAWGRYGFVDAFHADVGWYDSDVLGIDQGIGVLMAENLRSGFVWETFARNPEVGTAMKACGFRSFV